jgi:2-iminobutanoate/2-iminopropanoate deaminase
MQRISLPRQSTRPRITSDLVLVDGWAYVSGQAPIDFDNQKAPIPELVEDQVKKIFANLDRILKAAGQSKDDLVSVRVALVDLPRLYERMNAAYAMFFAPDQLPARSCVGVSHLPHGALVQMDFVLRAKR